MDASPPEQSGHESLGREAVEHALTHGDGAAAQAALLLMLQPRAQAGDEDAALVIRVLSAGTFAPDALAAAADRLAALVRAQDAQIRALRDMVDAFL